MTQIILPLYLTSTYGIVNGRINSMTPVSLFKTVCSAGNLFWTMYPEITLMIFMTAITPIQIKIYAGMVNAGSNLTRHTAKSTESAIVSSLEPNSLTEFVFRAITPSIMSENPASKYTEYYAGEKTGKSSKRTLHTILQAVIMFAMYFIRISSDLPNKTASFWEICESISPDGSQISPVPLSCRAFPFTDYTM